jgi:hypothetical protein
VLGEYSWWAIRYSLIVPSLGTFEIWGEETAVTPGAAFGGAVAIWVWGTRGLLNKASQPTTAIAESEAAADRT